MAKLRWVVALALAACACSTTDHRTSDASSAEVPAEPLPVPDCADGEHLTANNNNLLVCLPHTDELTASSIALDPDEPAIRLALRLVDDPSLFADIILGTSKMISSVDDVRFNLDDAATNGANMTVTVASAASNEAERDDVAWAVAFAVADFWGPQGGFRNEAGEVRTALTLVVDTTRYVAPMDLMSRVFDSTVSKSTFLQMTREA